MQKWSNTVELLSQTKKTQTDFLSFCLDKMNEYDILYGGSYYRPMGHIWSQ